MKLRKLVSAAAAVIAAGVMTISASATLVKPENPDPGLGDVGAMWLVQAFNVGNEAENKPAVSYDIDYSKACKVSITVQIVDNENRDWFENDIGGNVIFSINGGDIEHYVKDENGNMTREETELWKKYNWPQDQGFWGVPEPDLGFAPSEETDHPLKMEKVGDYTYKVTSPVMPNPLENGDAKEIGCMQIGYQDFANTAFIDLKILRVDLMDKDDNKLITFDENGVATVGGTPEPDYPLTGSDTSSDETSSEATSSDATSSEPTNSAATSSDATSSSAANVNSSVTQAPTENESEPPVGLIVGIIAGVAVIAVVVVVIVLKKKNG